jgi:catechol 2,3-dioxygenase-like lactoylglutathione lyase family enzyme
MGYAVPDCEAAAEFYTGLFGFRKLHTSPYIIMDREKDPNDTIFRIYGDKLQKVKIIFLTTGNGIGLELFEFIEPSMEQAAAWNFTRGGVFHVAFTDPDPEETCKRVVAAGGRQIGDTVSPRDNIKAIYMEDPWGNTIELLSCSFEELLAQRI